MHDFLKDSKHKNTFLIIEPDILKLLMKQSEMASLGGKARAKKYTKKQLSEMGKKGGRPKKKLSTVSFAVHEDEA